MFYLSAAPLRSYDLAEGKGDLALAPLRALESTQEKGRLALGTR
jgi:hypothetical protein